MTSLKVSIIIPVYNAEGSIQALIEDLHAVLNQKYAKHEIILVDDFSSDKSLDLIKQMSQSDKQLKYLSLRKNFGEHNAVMCGLNHMTGDVAVIMDDDFQNPPSEALKLIDAFDDDVDVVYAYYGKKMHSFFRNFGSWMNHWMANRLLQKPKSLYLSSFKAIRKEVVDEMVKYKGPFPYVDGLLLRVTQRIKSIKVDHSSRAVGKSSYTLSKLVSLYLNMFFNFSIKPLRVFTFIGIIIFLFGLIFSGFTVVEKMQNPDLAVGWASLILAVITFSGFQIIFLGLIGEYLGKQYLDQNESPQWIVHKKKLD